MTKTIQQTSSDPLFEKIRDSVLNIDPVSWAERYLTLDGKPYRIIGNGYKPIVDILRYICIKGTEKNSKPLVWVKGRQISGTTSMAVAEMYFMGSGLFGNGANPPMRICHLFPTLDQASSYSKVKLNAMIGNSISLEEPTKSKGKKTQSYMQTLIDKTSDSNDSLWFKQFQGGNHMFIEGAGLDGNRMRGKTIDFLACDEIQKFPIAAVSNSTKTLTKAQYGAIGAGIQVYLGTPLQRGSEFWEMWNKSTQQYFHLGCAKCKDHFPLYTMDSNEWENTWLYGYIVRCPHCGFEQDKREAVDRGRWVASREIGDSDFIGFHLNQLYMPEFTKEKIIAEKPENSAINTERTYHNEVLGQFWAGEAGIISPEQIRDICGDPGRKFAASISQDDDTLRFLGIDIGLKSDLEQLAETKKSMVQGQSYSVAVVLAATGPQRLSIERVVRFKRNDLESKKGIIGKLMRDYAIHLGVIDLGYTNDLSEILQTEYGSKFLSSTASHRVNDHIKYNDQVFPKTITFERDFYIAELYEQMKKGNIRFPLGSYDDIAWFIQHCTAFEIKPSVARNGEVSPKYVKTNFTDGFMALLNSYLAYKWFVSSGFTVNHPSLMKNSPNRRPPVSLGYVPRL